MAGATAAAPRFATALEERTYQRRWIALIILSLSLTLIVIDSTIVNIAFPAIRGTFGASYSDAEWVNSIYSLVFGAALITWGKLGDQFGRRTIFVAGALVFVIASAGVGFAGNIGLVIAFRALQGMGGAMMSPSTMSIISATFKGRERGIAFGIWGATAGVAAVLGPILGGWLIEYGTGVTAESWRLAFLINIPIGILAILGSLWAIRESRDGRTKHRIDWAGIVLASLALGSVVFGAIEGQTYGWLEAKKVFTVAGLTYPTVDASGVIPAGTPSFIPFAFGFGLIMLVLFIIVEMRQERNGGEPIFEFNLLKYRSYRYGLLTVSIVALGEFGILLVLSIFYQLAKGLGAFETGLQLIPLSIAMLVTAPTAGILSSRFGAKWVVTAGMMLEAVALFWMSQTLDIKLDSLTLPLVVYGVGLGLAIAQLANLVLSDIPSNKAGAASGANNTLRQLGASLGIAIIGAVLFGNFASATKPLVDRMTAFDDFSARVTANTEISKNARLIGSQFGNFADTAKERIKEGLDNNEGFDGGTDVLGSALDNMPDSAKTMLKNFGIDLSDPAVVEQIKTDLAPDAAILQDDIRTTLGTGYSEAARSAILVAAVFVGLGALSSILLPNIKATRGDNEPVMAH